MIYAISTNKPLYDCDDIKYISVQESIEILNKMPVIQLDTETSGWRNFLLIF